MPFLIAVFSVHCEPGFGHRPFSSYSWEAPCLLTVQHWHLIGAIDLKKTRSHWSVELSVPQWNWGTDSLSNSRTWTKSYWVQCGLMEDSLSVGDLLTNDLCPSEGGSLLPSGVDWCRWTSGLNTDEWNCYIPAPLLHPLVPPHHPSRWQCQGSRVPLPLRKCPAGPWPRAGATRR